MMRVSGFIWLFVSALALVFASGDIVDHSLEDPAANWKDLAISNYCDSAKALVKTACDTFGGHDLACTSAIAAHRAKCNADQKAQPEDIGESAGVSAKESNVFLGKLALVTPLGAKLSPKSTKGEYSPASIVKEQRHSKQLKVLQELPASPQELEQDNTDPCGTTVKGNAGGAGCSFPFTFKGKKYRECTSKGETFQWCYTKKGHRSHPKWGQCRTSCILSALKKKELRFSKYEKTHVLKHHKTRDLLRQRFTATVSHIRKHYSTGALKKWTREGDTGSVTPIYSKSTVHCVSTGCCTEKWGYAAAFNEHYNAITMMAYNKIACTEDKKKFVARKRLVRAWNIKCGHHCGKCYVNFETKECQKVAGMKWDSIDAADVDPNAFSVI